MACEDTRILEQDLKHGRISRLTLEDPTLRTRQIMWSSKRAAPRQQTPAATYLPGPHNAKCGRPHLVRENRTCSLGGGRRPAGQRASSDPTAVRTRRREGPNLSRADPSRMRSDEADRSRGKPRATAARGGAKPRQVPPGRPSTRRRHDARNQAQTRSALRPDGKRPVRNRTPGVVGGLRG